MTDIRIIAGSPTAEEVAVILAALASRRGRPEPARSNWGAPQLRVAPERSPWRPAPR